MVDIKKYPRVGRVFMKKHFSGQATDDNGMEQLLAMVSVPPMMFPMRHWLRWKIFSDPGGTDLNPHANEEWVMSVRGGDLVRTIVEQNIDTQSEAQAYFDLNCPQDVDSQEAQVNAQNVGITGGEYKANIGKPYDIFERKYKVGFPNHAMLIGAKTIMYHAMGDTNKNPYFKAPRGMTVEEANIIGIGFARNQPIDGGTDWGTNLFGGLGDGNSLVDMYEAIHAAIPTTGGNPDYTVSDTDLGANVKNWLSLGNSQGDYDSSTENDIHFSIDWTIEMGVYTPRQYNTISAP